jgi:ADP-heptose:LPS heptosyltransferase
MRDEKFDLAVQLHGGGRHSNPFVRRLGARVTVGLKSPDAPPLDRWLPYIYFQHEYVRYLEVTALAGAKPVVLEPRLRVTDRDRAEAAAQVSESGRPLAILHPGAGDPRRRWPPENFAAVADALIDDGARVGVIGTAGERPVVEAVLRELARRRFDESSQTLDLCDKLSLGGLAALLERAAVVVSDDSGPLHLAFAVGARTVGIYWCFNLYTSCPLTRARHHPFVSWQLNCPDCGHTCVDARCEHTSSLVTSIPVGNVRDAALGFLREKSVH